MDPKDFAALKYGNVVQDERGNRFLIQHVVRDAAGNATHVGYIPCNDAGDAKLAGWSMVNAAHGETFIEGNVLKGRTVQP